MAKAFAPGKNVTVDFLEPSHWWLKPNLEDDWSVRNMSPNKSKFLKTEDPRPFSMGDELSSLQRQKLKIEFEGSLKALHQQIIEKIEHKGKIIRNKRGDEKRTITDHLDEVKKTKEIINLLLKEAEKLGNPGSPLLKACRNAFDIMTSPFELQISYEFMSARYGQGSPVRGVIILSWRLYPETLKFSPKKLAHFINDAYEIYGLGKFETSSDYYGTPWSVLNEKIKNEWNNKKLKRSKLLRLYILNERT